MLAGAAAVRGRGRNAWLRRPARPGRAPRAAPPRAQVRAGRRGAAPPHDREQRRPPRRTCGVPCRGARGRRWRSPGGGRHRRRHRARRLARAGSTRVRSSTSIRSTGCRSCTGSRSSTARSTRSAPTTAPVAELADDQLAAVTHAGGAARIIAPAGSGKTRVLAERARHLLRSWALPPGSVTLVAFNKRAQLELRERTSDLPGLQVRTLNAIALAIVNGSAPFARRPRQLRTVSEGDVRRLLGRLVRTRAQAQHGSARCLGGSAGHGEARASRPRRGRGRVRR